MQPQDSAQSISDHPEFHNPLSVMQPGEQVICEIKRHPIGIFGVFVGTGLFLVILAVLGLIVVPGFVESQNHDQVMLLGAVVFFVFAALSMAFVFISNIVYWGNRWVVTSDSITQITQTSLFRKQSSQLSLGNLEDVTTEKNGILSQLFNFGVLKAETAGERSKFMFLFCPNPNFYAQKILAAREAFEQGHHGGKQVPYQQPGPGQAEASEYPSPQPQQPTAPPIYPEQPQPTQPDQGYGSYKPYDNTPPAAGYSDGAVDHGVNINTEQ